MNKHFLLTTTSLLGTFIMLGCGGGGSNQEQTQAENNKNFSQEVDANLEKKSSLSAADYEREAKRLKEVVFPVNSDNTKQLQLVLVENQHDLIKYQNGKFYASFNILPEGLSVKPVILKINDITGRGNLYTNQLPYSIVSLYRDYDREISGFFRIGSPTRIQEIPAAGKAQYQGYAFDGREQGNLIYNIDFAKKEGSGKILGLSNFGEITLHSAPLESAAFTLEDSTIQATEISNAGVSSEKYDLDAGTLRSYSLKLFGPQAKELGGAIESSSYDPAIVFNGERGEIK